MGFWFKVVCKMCILYLKNEWGIPVNGKWFRERRSEKNVNESQTSSYNEHIKKIIHKDTYVQIKTRKRVV